jgi:formylmethanofuran dehydrogenase subunit E-like metal-binding protein
MIKRILKSSILVVLATVLFVGAALITGCASESLAPTSETTTGEASIVSDYPGLTSLVDFVGEENLSVMNLVGFKAADKAMKELGFEKSDPNVLALTDAGYIAKIGEYTTEKALDGVVMTSGLSRGKGNLANLHKAYNYPLWFAFFDKTSKDCVYLEPESESLKDYLDREKTDRDAALRDFMKLKDEEIFAMIAKENIDADRLLDNPEAWQEKMLAKVFGGNEFSIFTISNLWAMGLPNDFLKVAELHDHICPGLTSGYLIAEYVIKHFPASDPRNEYIVIAIPPWCKDDALIQIFETNVGHKRLFVKWLTKEQKEALPEEAKNVANIFINTKTNKGIVVGFDWDKAFEEAELPSEWLKDFETWHWWNLRLKMDICMMDHLDNPEALIFTIKEFTTTPEQIEKLKSAGVNPLVELGIMKP